MSFYIIKRKQLGASKYQPPIDGSQIVPVSILPQAISEVIIIGERFTVKDDADTTKLTIFYAEAPGNRAIISGWNGSPIHIRSADIAYVSSADGKGVVIHAGNTSPTAPTGENLDLKSDDDINITPGSGAYRAKVTRMDIDSDAPAYAKNIVYVNSGSVPVLVVVTCDIEDAEAATLQIGASNPPGTTVCQASYDTGAAGGVKSVLLTVVPVGWYYRLSEASATITIVEWHEFGIGGTATTAAA